MAAEQMLGVNPAQEPPAQEASEHEIQLMRAELDELRRNQRLRDETIALVVHDMKNPLAGVLSNAEYLITSKELTDDQDECVRDIVSASRRLHRQVLSLLDVNLREHGALEPSLTTVDLAELVDEVMHECRPSLSDKNLECAIEGIAGPMPITADRDMLSRLLANLLDHAARSSPVGAQIRMSLSRTPHWVEIRVNDRGPRLAPEYRAQMFETYLPADQVARRTRKGRGLGLASCRAIAEAHGGIIQADDAVREGNTLHVQLPLSPPTRH